MSTLDLSDQQANGFPIGNCPWLDIRLPEDIIEYLWHIINHNKILQITNPVFLSEEGITHTGVDSELGDWRDSLTEINE